MGGPEEEEEGGKNLDVGSSGTTRTPSSRVTRTKQIARDVASVRNLH